MKFARFARCVAGIALFYGTVAGVCQNIAPLPEPNPALKQETQARPEVDGSSANVRITIRYLSVWTKKDGQIPRDCQDVLGVLLPYIRAYPHPAGWTWFVACDEASWDKIQRSQGNQVGSGILAITNRPGHSTIIRGSAMLHPYNDDYRAQPEHIVAHELCHIYLQSSDEAKVDELATRWVNERRASNLAVLRP